MSAQNDSKQNVTVAAEEAAVELVGRAKGMVDPGRRTAEAGEERREQRMLAVAAAAVVREAATSSPAEVGVEEVRRVSMPLVEEAEVVRMAWASVLRPWGQPEELGARDSTAAWRWKKAFGTSAAAAASCLSVEVEVSSLTGALEASLRGSQEQHHLVVSALTSREAWGPWAPSSSTLPDPTGMKSPQWPQYQCHLFSSAWACPLRKGHPAEEVHLMGPSWNPYHCCFWLDRLALEVQDHWGVSVLRPYLGSAAHHPWGGHQMKTRNFHRREAQSDHS